MDLIYYGSGPERFCTASTKKGVDLVNQLKINSRPGRNFSQAMMSLTKWLAYTGEYKAQGPT